MWKVFFRGFEKYDINMDELKQKQNNGAIIIDVRSEQEYSEGHIDKAINLPDYKINKNSVSNILEDKTKEIIVYCQNGGRSRKAYKKLKKLGFEYVYNLYGGVEEFL